MGTVTDQIDAARLDGASIVLYPVSGVEREPVTVTGAMNGSTLEWSALIQPGEWVVVVTEANPGPNGGGTAYALLDATVANGGNVSMVMALGGYVALETLWLDIEQSEHHAGSDDSGAALIDEPVEIEVSYDNMAWMMAVPADGVLEQLFPEGTISYDSEFSTTQHSTSLSMEYYGGQTVSVLADTTINSVLEYNRRVNSDLVLSMDASSVTGASVEDEDDRHLLATVSTSNNSMFNTITVEVDVTYNGTETMDIFTVTGEMGLAQDSDDWTVAVLNATSGEFEDAVDISMGVGSDDVEAVLMSTVTLQITLPDVADAWHLEDAHRVTVRLETELGEASTVQLKVEVPQSFGFSLPEEIPTLGMGALVERQFSVDITNDGNGRDTFTSYLVEEAIPEGWSITPLESTMVLAKGETRAQTFTAFAPEDFSEGEFTLTVYVDSEGSDTTQDVSVTIQSARIALVVDQNEIVTASDQYTNEEGAVVVPVRNTGLLDAPSVFVYLTDEATGEEMQVNINVPAEGETLAVFDGIIKEQAGNARFSVRIDVQGQEADFVDSISEGGEFDFQIEYNPRTTADGDSPWLTVVIVLLGALVVYGGVKTSRSRGGSRF